MLRTYVYVCICELNLSTLRKTKYSGYVSCFQLLYASSIQHTGLYGLTMFIIPECYAKYIRKLRGHLLYLKVSEIMEYRCDITMYYNTTEMVVYDKERN